jgi:hypothetical protein
LRRQREQGVLFSVGVPGLVREIEGVQLLRPADAVQPATPRSMLRSPVYVPSLKTYRIEGRRRFRIVPGWCTTII